MKKLLLTLALLLLLFSCSSENTSSISAEQASTGTLFVKLDAEENISGSLNIIIAADDFTQSIEEDFTRDNLTEAFTIHNIPVGIDRSISIEAYDEENNLIYIGSEDGIIITENTITEITITLISFAEDETTGSLSIYLDVNNAPNILSLIIDPETVYTSSLVNLYCISNDADNDDITYSWEASAGSFDDISLQAPIWTAPNNAQDVSFTITIYDGFSESEFSFNITIESEPVEYALVINEFLADPPEDPLLGDVNQDGIVSTSEDEFIEIVNYSETSINLENFSIYDSSSLRHTFTANDVLGSYEAIVIFGGGNIDALTYTATIASEGCLSLNNSGDEIYLKDAQGNTIDSTIYAQEGGNNESLTLDPDITGEFIGHTNIGDVYSPGYRNDGSEF
ncbi:MAG: lamin tail domain-containing protein [Pseudomonadota bacterium]